MAHGDILAQLTLGTWRYLLPDRDRGRQLLWQQALHRAFPDYRQPSKALVGAVHGIYLLRNRVAHLEPILDSGLVRRRYHAMREVLTGIDPAVATWLDSRQRITPTLRSRPGERDATD